MLMNTIVIMIGVMVLWQSIETSILKVPLSKYLTSAFTCLCLFLFNQRAFFWWLFQIKLGLSEVFRRSFQDCWCNLFCLYSGGK